MEHHGSQKETDTLGSTVNGSGQSTSLAREVEVQVEPQQMLKDISCNFSNSFLCYTSKYGIPQFLEECCSYPSGTIWNETVSPSKILARTVELLVPLTGYNHRSGHGICSSTNSCKINVH